MNLVAKEYVATRINQDGVLILSEMAGAASEMQEALHINPNSVSQFSEVLKKALEMPLQEQKTQFDFKGFVRNEKKPFSVKSVEELKEKKFTRPIFTEEQLHQKINNRKNQGIIFDEITPDLNENDGTKTEDSKSYNKKSYKSERLTSDVEKEVNSSPFRAAEEENPAPLKELSEKEKKKKNSSRERKNLKKTLS